MSSERKMDVREKLAYGLKVKEVTTKKGYQSYLEQAKIPIWTVYTRTNAPLSRTGWPLEYYPLKRSSPALDKFLYSEVYHLSFWCPMPGCDFGRCSSRQQPERKWPIFANHWLSIHADPTKIDIKCTDTCTSRKKFCPAVDPPLTSLKVAHDHWENCHNLTEYNASHELKERSQVWLEKLICGFGPLGLPYDSNIPSVKYNLIPESSVQHQLNMPFEKTRCIDHNPHRLITLEGFLRELSGPEDLLLTRQNWSETLMPSDHSKKALSLKFNKKLCLQPCHSDRSIQMFQLY
jgi:hypothetical protein